MPKTVADIVGNTPLVHLKRLSSEVGANIYLKLEFMSPWFSVKDRIAKNIIEKAESEGKIKPGSHIIEATSGNTGISLAGVCALKGYKLTVIMPEFVSEERKLLLRLLGAEIILTPAEQGLVGPVAKSFEMAENDSNVFIADQTRNPANPEAHLKTGQEIWDELEGQVDVVVAASGTGGHLTGIGTKLKTLGPQVEIMAVEPQSAAVLSGKVEIGEANPDHGLTGVGPGFIPDTLNQEVIDRVLVVDEEESFETVKQIIANEGLLIGPSTGAVISAVKSLASEDKYKNKSIVAVATSSTERYLSTNLTDDARNYLNKLVPSPASEYYMEKVKE